MFEPTIGLEVHAELRTQTKMFCDSKNDPNERTPNVNVCPVCMAHPGVLPTINKKAVEHVLRVGLSMGGQLADYSEFDRKNYFYPDIPKAFQLSQYEFPLVSGGMLDGVALTRIHLEEDTARSSHTSSSDFSLVDFNRGGIPLMELVTEPVIHSATQASHFARELQLLLRTLGASDANMEKGEMRVEANISVSKNKAELGVKVEVKNLNSFRAVERAIDFEIKRHIAVLESGGHIVQETRGWDENKEVTFSQRLKEEAADYRYFPEPDLPKLKISEVAEFNTEVLRATLPELPVAKRIRLTETYNLSKDIVEVYVTDSLLCAFFEDVVAALDGHEDAAKKSKLASNYIVNNLMAQKGVEGRHITELVNRMDFLDVVSLAYDGDISSNAAVELIAHLVETGTQEKSDIRELARTRGLLQENNEELLMETIDAVLSENQEAVTEFREGKEQALQFLVGQGMKKSRGSANPAKLKELIKAKLA